MGVVVEVEKEMVGVWAPQHTGVWARGVVVDKSGWDKLVPALEIVEGMAVVLEGVTLVVALQ